MDIMTSIAEDKIKTAIKNKEFEDIPGLGKPLDLKDDLPGMSNELKMSYRMLKNAGYTPDEVKKDLLRIEDLLACATDELEIQRLQEKRTKKQLELERLLEKRGTSSNSRFGSYADKIFNKLK
jgi:septation ring formation regulator EzrA